MDVVFSLSFPSVQTLVHFLSFLIRFCFHLPSFLLHSSFLLLLLLFHFFSSSNFSSALYIVFSIHLYSASHSAYAPITSASSPGERPQHREECRGKEKRQ